MPFLALRTRARFAAVAPIVLLLLAPASAAAAQVASDAGTWKVTVASRVCDDYTDVMANRARNDIQESLRDLGTDTVYAAGQAISAQVEDANNDCRPLVGWDFKLGVGVGGADTGPWGSLSRVSTPDAGVPRTVASIALLDKYGHKTGEQIAGATTFKLTSAQYERTKQQRLWIQGGVPGDPVLQARFPDEYGFAALRCAIDNLNGDNVEWIAYPSGSTHVMCFAYYVKPPPTSGTITIRKEVVTAPGQTYDEDFAFTGNITFNADGRFRLGVRDNQPASETFTRAEVTPGVPAWTAEEQVPDGWVLLGVDCVSRTGASSSVVTGAKVAVTLAALDDVTCTYRNARQTTGPLLVGKRTLGWIARTKVTVDPPAGAARSWSLLTLLPGVTRAVETGFTRRVAIA